MRISVLRLLVWGACTVACVGCDQAASEPMDGAQSPSGKADDADADDAGPQLADAYAVRLSSNVEVRQDDGELATHNTEVVALAVVTQHGADVEIEMTPCAIDLPASDYEPELGPEVIDSLDAFLISGAAVFGEDDTPLFLADPAAILAGVELGDPLLDEMPSDPDDPRFFDQDGDDRPGVSVGVSAFTVYAAARVVFALTGEVDAEGAIEGDADLSLDFTVLGDSIPFVDARERAEESAAGSEVLSEDHRFIMVPLSAETCADVLGAV